MKIGEFLKGKTYDRVQFKYMTQNDYIKLFKYAVSRQKTAKEIKELVLEKSILLDVGSCNNGIITFRGNTYNDIDDVMYCYKEFSLNQRTSEEKKSLKGIVIVTIC